MKSKLGISLSDASTWRGLGMMIVGYSMESFTPDTNRWFIPLMLILIGALGFFVRDEPKPAEPGQASGSLDDVVRRNQS